NTVVGNFIGVDGAGTGALGNGGNGVLMQNGAHDDVIGGAGSGMANTIAFNAGAGVTVTGAGSINNAILSNSIHDHAGLGILLASGANNNQAAPALTAAFSSTGVTVITGTLTGTANATFRLEFFANTAGDPEGRTLLGSWTVATDSAGHGSFTAVLLA